MQTHNIHSTDIDRGGFDSAGRFNRDIPIPKFGQTLVVKGHRYGIGQVPAGTKARMIHRGALHDGPFAYTFKRSSVIAADPEQSTWGQMQRDRAAGLVIDAAPEDILRLDGVEYQMIVDSRGYIELEREDQAVIDLNDPAIGYDPSPAGSAHGMDGNA